MEFNSSSSQNFRKAIILVAVILFLINLWLIDYEHLFSRENLGDALGGMSNIFLIAAMAASIRHTKKRIGVRRSSGSIPEGNRSVHF